MIDTHAHLTDPCYADRLHEMITNFKDNDLDYVFTVGFDYKSSVECIKLAEKYDNVYAVIGVHPDEIHTLTDECVRFLEENATHPKVVAIGEIGLDYHMIRENHLEQKKAFVKQLEIANKYNLPVVIHNRDSVGDILQVLKENKHLLNNGGVIHCFSESFESFKEFKKLGFIVGLGGVITFKNAKNTINLIEQLEFSDFVIETDCPYLTPEPFRGKMKNEPRLVKHVLEKIADIKNVSTSVVKEHTNKNALNLFKKVK